MNYPGLRLMLLAMFFIFQFVSISAGDSRSFSKSNGLPGTAQLSPEILEKLSQSKMKARKKTPRPDSVGSDMQPDPQSAGGNGATSSSTKVPTVGKIRIVDAAGKVTELDVETENHK